MIEELEALAQRAEGRAGLAALGLSRGQQVVQVEQVDHFREPVLLRDLEDPRVRLLVDAVDGDLEGPVLDLRPQRLEHVLDAIAVAGAHARA